MRFDLRQGDCRDLLRSMADASVDSIVTDPPYHLTTGKRGGSGPASVNLDSPHGRARVGTGFMGMTWDGGDVAHDPALWAEALRVAKPGAWLLAFGGTRTYHRLACAIEDAGWELRDSPLRGHQHQPEDCPWLGGWMFGSGFPKSHNGEWGGTALKPAWEPIVMARKPLIGTVEANWREHGTGALNIDGCRVGSELVHSNGNSFGAQWRTLEGRDDRQESKPSVSIGRWPANLLHDGSDEIVSLFPGQSGQLKTRNSDKFRTAFGAFGGTPDARFEPHDDTGSAARFFYCAKATREDRNEGCEHIDKRALNWSSGEQNPGSFQSPNTDRSAHNFHPTVKPTDLMRWLVRLVTPRGGLVLDPFMGSGSTGKAAMLEGLRFIGCELQADYLDIARARIEFALRQGHQPSLTEAA